MAADIHVHHEVLRAHLKGCFGYEIATEGDSFKCVFRSAEDAVIYCILVQLDLLTAPWQIETGGHEILLGSPTWSSLNNPKLSKALEDIVAEPCAQALESFAGKQKQCVPMFSPAAAAATPFSQHWLNSEASAVQ
jgi:hypothetical protein